ncbi:class I SAM-dependent methyltransferase [Ligilactobacillus sp. WILCCON 0076]|uniref:Class I SAM-dependent methyltransferase n=1 Tax=Ligilactobacillus ubinensis TaxID=2876789 RepID=A0A9X2FI68_9LACO|nr:class I SAM-dependent methyltransferase [Ligilactobacillus ubinensis]MCP0886391.1 class I SAM-dependent methyltransferase [Ligilactobacillus ubinensis]
MTNYYYTKNPDVEHDEKKWDFTLLGNKLHFITDNGVFSKRRVDFGSCVLLNAIELYDFKDAKLLDVGCGYGPLGLALAKKFPTAVVDMIDVNELALDLAKRNAQNNGITNSNIWESNQYEEVKQSDYNVIITNPPIRAGKEVVHNILSGAKDHLRENGMLIAVLQKKQGAPSAKKKMEEVFGNCTVIAKEKGYFILQSTKE